MVSVGLFSALVATVIVQRFCELRMSRKNEEKLRALGAREHAPEQMPFMVFLHATWLPAMLLEVILLKRPFDGTLALFALSAFSLGQALRTSAMSALGPRWTVKIITLPGTLPIRHGIFRFIRHPNYLGVALEIAALPLVHSAYLSAVIFSIANAVLMFFRIRAEERALTAAAVSDAAHAHGLARSQEV